MSSFRTVLLAVLLGLGWVSAQDANCDFSQNIQPGQTYYITSPNYPSSYRPGVQCRWIAICPSGYNCRLDCADIALPQSPSCSVDRLLVSRTGDPQLSGAEYYCGRGTLSAVSTGQRLALGLITSRNSSGGRFSCQLVAQPVTPTPGQCSCGYRRVDRIVGGEETKINEYPMMAGIVDARISQIKCGAVIISEQYVLTAAHCVVGMPIASTAVVVGEHDVSTGADTSATQIILVDDFIVHPQYTSSNYDYDIAIVRLRTNIRFSDRVGPVCLPFKFINNAFAGSKVTILGWGTLFIGGPTSNVLRKVDVDVISQATCQRSIPSLTRQQMCTYTPGKDACQDDSGGPLLYTDPATGLLFNIGIVSYGRFCASNEPGVNTRVTALLSWITTSAPANYCMK